MTRLLTLRASGEHAKSKSSNELQNQEGNKGISAGHKKMPCAFHAITVPGS